MRTKTEELIKRYRTKGRTVKEEFEFEKEVEDYLETEDLPEEDKIKLGYYTESIGMLCSGLRISLEEGKIKETDII